ncbi:hypothetical protein FACS189430_00940 [Bacteroidia bacterium]|nr:hypothetical protein FACS189430_00940 [Bacteroidia bacterium]
MGILHLGCKDIDYFYNAKIKLRIMNYFQLRTTNYDELRIKNYELRITNYDDNELRIKNYELLIPFGQVNCLKGSIFITAGQRPAVKNSIYATA